MIGKEEKKERRPPDERWKATAVLMSIVLVYGWAHEI